VYRTIKEALIAHQGMRPAEMRAAHATLIVALISAIWVFHTPVSVAIFKRYLLRIPGGLVDVPHNQIALVESGSDPDEAGVNLL